MKSADPNKLTQMVHFRCTAKELETLKTLARSQNRGVSNMVLVLVREALAKISIDILR